VEELIGINGRFLPRWRRQLPPYISTYPHVRATSSIFFPLAAFGSLAICLTASCASALKYSVKFEFDFNTDLHGHRLPIFQGRIEAPALHCFHRLRIEP
jgi:hypothetical protein